MKTWIFAGLGDHSDLLLYLCKICSSADYKVLLVDATSGGRYAYTVGQLDRPLAITEFSQFDVARGFSNYQELLAHYQAIGESVDKYDYILCDLDQSDFFSTQSWVEADARIWVSDQSIWALEQGIRFLTDLAVDECKGIKFHLVFHSAVDTLLGEEFLDSYMANVPVTWLHEPVRIPWNEVDIALKLENEHQHKLRMKNLSKAYKRSLSTILAQLMSWDDKYIKKAVRTAERSKV